MVSMVVSSGNPRQTWQMKHLISFGHGYSARQFCLSLPSAEWRITGTTRSAEKAETVRSEGVEALIWPGGNQDAALGEAMMSATHILISAVPTPDGDPVIAEWRKELVRRSSDLEWVGYLSTTGVYGDHQGGWVDEGSALSPSTRRGQMRVAAEAQWQALAREDGLPLHIFRLAGIYGPGRGPFAKLRNGTARRIIKENQVFSRTHVEDIAQVLEASISQPNPGAIYNVCDDEPAPPQDVIACAAELLGLPLPPEEPFETAEMSPMARSFYSDSKRVRNDRIKAELSVDLKYPTYKECLAAMLAAENVTQ